MQTKNGLTFDIIHEQKKYSIQTSCLGDYMADNITGCFALTHQIGIAPEKIIAAIKTFKSLKRRLEKRYEGAATIFDDIAHSPSKAQAILKTLRQTFNGKILAIFEPNTGNRRPEVAVGYNQAFASADEVIIPRLTAIKIDPADPTRPYDGATLATIIGQTHAKTIYLDDDAALISYLKQKIQPGNVVVFMGSHGFRGMIEELIASLREIPRASSG